MALGATCATQSASPDSMATPDAGARMLVAGISGSASYDPSLSAGGPAGIRGDDMGFASGAVSFRRFRVTGKNPGGVGQEALDKLQEFILHEGEYGVPEEVEHGWCGGRHIYDSKFSFEH